MTNEARLDRKISVVIPAYNTVATLRRCVESVLATGYAPLEVILVDDASTDETSELIDSLARESPALVMALHLRENGGPARARNTGAKAATGAYYFFLDADTALSADAFTRFIDRIGDAHAVSGIYHFEALDGGMAATYKALFNHFTFSRRGVFEYEVFNGAVGGVRADVFNALGGYNESLGWGMDYENEEFGHRLVVHHRALIDPEITARHAFPGIAKMTALYARRVALWMELFMSRRRFEAGGPAERGTGLATVGLPVALLTLPLIMAHPAGAVLPILALGLWLWGYAGFFGYVLRRNPAFLPMAVLLNSWFSVVITTAAGIGALRWFAGIGRTKPADG